LGIGISLAFVLPSHVEPSLGYIFLGGFVAISAMLLPGISGAFILLILGVYEFMLGAINDLFNNLNYVFVFILGAIAGLFVMSRVISFFFRKDKSGTLYLLLGLVVGALSVPLKGVYGSIEFTFVSLIVHVVLFVLGVVFALSITHFSRNKYLVKN